MLKAKATRNAKNGIKDKVSNLSSGEAALAGAIAGSFSAGITTPLDVMKSKVRTDGGNWRACIDKINVPANPKGPPNTRWISPPPQLPPTRTAATFPNPASRNPLRPSRLR